MMMRDGHVPCQQDGVFRSNCMDCLDRTNVVQGLFAKVTLEEQLQVRPLNQIFLTGVCVCVCFWVCAAKAWESMLGGAGKWLI